MIKTPQIRVLFKHTLSRFRMGVFAAFIAIGIILSVLSLFDKPVQAATASTLNFQARLLNNPGNIVTDGKYNVEFKLYNVATGGTALWTETYYDSNGPSAGNDNRVTVRAGYLSVYLGGLTSFPGTINWDQDLYLTMNIGGTTQTATPTYDGEMDPRIKLTAVPYAFKAAQLAQLNAVTGFTSTLRLAQPTVGNQEFVVPDQAAAGTFTLLTTQAANVAYIQNQATLQQASSQFWISGSGRADTSFLTPAVDTAAAATLSLGVTNATAVSISRTGVTTTVNGSLTVTEAATFNGNVVISGTNTLTVGTGATALGGTLTVAGDTTLNGTQLTNTGSTLNAASALSDFPTGGAIGTAAATVDAKTSFTINQTTASQTLSLPAPTVTTAGRIVYVSNVGAQTFTMHGIVIAAGSNASFLWNGTSWRPILDSGVAAIGVIDSQTKSANGAVIVGNSLYLQTADTTYPGLVSTGAQTFGGAKTFDTALTVTGAGINSFNGPATFGSSGNFGVVTLQMQSQTNFSSGLRVQKRGNTTDVDGAVASGAELGYHEFFGWDGNAYVRGAYVIANATEAWTNTGRGTSYSIATTANGTTTNVTRMIIDQNGNVGIGDMTPAAMLTVGSGDAFQVTSVGNVTTSGTLTVNGSQFTNAGATLNTVMALSDFPTGGAIGAAATTVDVKTAFTINQTTAGQSLSLPTPTDTAAGRLAYISNIGSTSFTIHSTLVASGSNAVLVWNGTAWRAIVDSGVAAIGTLDSQPKSADGAVILGSGLYMQTADTTNPGLVSIAAQTFAGNKTFNGTVTVGQLLTANAGATVSGGAISLTGNAASSLTTTSGALTITSAAAATWSTTAGNLTLQAGSGTVSLGTSTSLTANGALSLTSGGTGALTLDTSGAAAINIGTTNANAINLQQNTTIAATKTLTVSGGATSLTGASAGSATAVTVNSGATTNVGLLVQGVASQTADLLQVKANGVAAAVLGISANGNATFRNAVDGSNSLQVLNAAGNNVLSVNTGTSYTLVLGRSGTGVLGYVGTAAAGTYQGASVNNRTFTFQKSVPVNNTIIGSLALSTSTTPSTTDLSISDTKGNSYTVHAAQGNGSSVAVFVFSSVISNALTPSDTITLTVVSGTGRWVLDIEEFDNVLTSGAFDQSTTNTGNSISLSSGTTGVTSNANELVFGSFGYSAGRTFTAGSGFTASAQQATNAGSNDRALNNEWKFVTTTGTQEATATLSTSSAYSGAITTFRVNAPDTGARAKIGLNDGSTSGYMTTLTFNNALTASRNVYLPDASGTLCLDTGNCSGAGGYIVNGTALQTGNFNISGTGTASTSLLTPLLDTASAGTLSVGTSTATAVSISRTGVATTVNGTLTVAESATFNGSQLTNGGATLNTVTALNDFPTGGSIGTAATTVDVKTAFTVNQTTAGQTLTLPSPTNTAAGRIVYISNIGTASFIMHSQIIPGGANASFLWNGTTWRAMLNSGISGVGTIDSQTKSADGAVVVGSALYLQTADATYPGLVSTTAQTFAGDKTFNGVVTIGAAGTALSVTNDASIGGNLIVGGAAVSSARLSVTSGAAGQVAAAIKGASGQTANLLQLQNNSDEVLASFSNTGQLTLGRIATTGTNVAGTVTFADGTTSGFGATLGTATLTADRSFRLPDSALATTASPGTLCVFNGVNTNCPVASGSTYYIQNGTTVQPNANYYIRSSGTGAVTAVLEGANGQTADLLNLNSYNGTASTVVARVTAAGNLQVASNIDTVTTTGLTIGGTNANAITISRTGVTTTVNGALTVAEATTFNGNVSISGANTFTVGTGATSLGGTLTVAGVTTFNGSQMTNNGATLSTALALSDFPTGGSIGSAATTVDIRTGFTVNQTTASQTLTLPNPTSATAGRTIYISNIGSASFIVSGKAIAPGTTATYIWNGTTWTLTSDTGTGVTTIGTIDSQTKSADGAVINDNTLYLQTADATSVGLVSTGAQTFAGAKTFNALITGNAGATVSGGAVSLTGNAASSFTTSSGALTLTSATAATWSTTAGNLTLQAGSGTVSLGTSTALTASGALTVTSGGATAMTVDAGGAASLNLGTTNANAVSISRTGVTTTVNGALTVAEATTFNGNVNVSGTNTFTVGTGATTLGGTLAVTGNSTLSGTLTVSGNTTLNGSQFTNTGSTVNTALALSDFPIGGSIGSAATTVDIKTSFTVNQTTAGQSLTLPSPTNTAAGRIVYVSNIGTTSFTLSGLAIAAGSNASYLWNGTAWKGVIDGGVTTIGTIDSQTKSADGAVISGNSIYLQTADASNPGLVSTGTQTFAGAKTFNGAVTMAAAGTGLSVTNNISTGTINNLTLSSATDGFTVAGGTTSRTLTVTGANITVGNVIQPTAAGTLAVQSNGANTLTFDTGGAAAVNLGTTNANAVSISRTGITTTINGALTVSEAATFNGNVSISGANTLTVSTGATSLGGTLTVAGNTTLNGSQFTNTGSTVNSALALGNFPTGGTIGSAATTVDVKTTFTINQTTTGQTLTLPSPTSATAGRVIYIANVGSASFNIGGAVLMPSSIIGFVWNGTNWASTGSGTGISLVGTLDGQTKSVDGAVINGNSIYLQTADATNPGLVSTGTQTFAGAKTFNGAVTITAAGTGLSVSNNVSIGGNLTVTGSISGNGVNAGTGLLQGTGGLTVTGTTSINTTGTANTSIGNATGTFSLQSSGLNVSTGGALTGVNGIANAGAYTQSGTSTNTFTGVSNFTAAGTALSVTNNLSAGTINNLTLTSATDGFTVAGGTTSRTLTVTGASITVGNVIQPTAAGALAVQSNGANALTLDTGAAATVNVGTTNANAVSISRTGVTTTVNGALTVSELLTGSAGATVSGGAVSLTGNAASSFTTTSGALTLTSATAATWSTTAGNLTIQAGSGTVSLGTSTALTANGALSVSSGGATTMTVDAGGAATLNLGTANASAVSISRTGVTTTVNGALTVAEATTFNGNVSITGANTLTVGTGATTLGGTLAVTGNSTLSGTLTVGGNTTLNGSQFTNNGSTVNTVLALGDFATGGSIGSAATTVDVKTGFSIAQTTTGQTLTLATPTSATAGRIVYVSNTGSATFTMYGIDVSPNANASFLWNGSTWNPTATAGVTSVGTIDSQTKSANGVVIVGNVIYMQTADASNPGLVSTGTQTFAGAKTFNGAVTMAAAGTGLSVTNNASIGGNLTVTGSITGTGVNAGTGLLQGTGGLTITGATSINTTGTANTAIGNSTGTFSLASSALNVSTAGALSGVNGISNAGAYTQSGTSANTFTGASTFSAAGTALTVTNNISTGTINNLTLSSAADGFTVAGGTTSRTLTVTGASITVGNVIQPTAAGTLAIQSNGANALTLDTGGAAAVNIGTTNANAVSISRTGVTTTVNGALTVSELLTGSAGATVSGGAVSLTGNAASSFTTSSGALTLTSAAATTWSTTAGNLTIQAGSGTVSLGTSTNLIAAGALTVASGGATTMTVDAGGAATLNLGTTNANAVSISRTGVTTTINGALTVSEAATFNGNVSISGANTLTVGTGATSLGGTLAVAGAATFNGSLVTNNGATLSTALALSDFPTGGSIGSAATTVDIRTGFTINQTTAGQTVTLPNPTTTTAGRAIYVSNIGSASFTIAGKAIAPGSTTTYIWNGSAWTLTSDTGTGVTTIGTIDSQTKSADGAVVVGSALYLQTADATNPGLVSTGTQTFAGAKTFNGAVTMAAAGTGLSVTNNASVGGNLTVTGSITGTGVNAGSGLLQGTGGLTITGTTSINTTGTANTAIGNATGTFALTSSGLNVSTAGALTGVTGITTSGGYTQSGTTANTFTGASTFSAAGTALTVTNNISTGTINNLTLTSATDGFTIAGGTTSRTLTVTGASVTVGDVIQPTAAGTLTVQSNGANALTLDTGAAATVNVGTTNANAVSISRTGVTTTVNGALTVSQLLTGSAGATVSGGAVSLTGNAASSFTTSSGALTLTSATAATWSTSAGDLTIQAGSGTVSLGTSSVLTANGALAVRSGGATTMTVDAGGAATLNLGTTNANAVSISRTGVTTTVNGALTVAEATTFNGSVSISGANTLTVGTGATSLGGTLAVAGATTFNGSLVTNNGATLNTALALSNFATGGSLGSAATTVDVKTGFTVNQTTAGQTLTLPSPTNAAAGRTIYVSNIGSAGFTIGGTLIAPSATATYVWNGTAWTLTSDTGTGVTTIGTIDSQTKSADGAVISGNSLYLQTADATNPGLVSTGTQTFAGAKTFNGAVTMAAAGTALTVTNNASVGGSLTVTGNVAAGTINNLTLTSATDGFTVAGGTTSRTLTVTGASITVGNVIQPTAAGTLSIQSNGANTLSMDAGGAAAVNLGTANANAVSISRTGVTTTVNGALTVSQLLTGNAGATVSGGAISLTGNAASSFTTSSGALTLTSAAAATWSTTAGNLTLQAGSGTVSLGTSTNLTAGGALNITSGGTSALTLDTSGAAAINIGTTNANAINLQQNTTVAATKTLTVTSGATTLTGASAGSGTAVTINTGAASNVGLLVQGAASQTADLLQVKANGVAAAVLGVSANGNATFRNATDGANSLQVLNAAGNNVLSVNTGTSYTLVLGRSGTGVLGYVGTAAAGTYQGASVNNRTFSFQKSVSVNNTIIGSLVLSSAGSPSTSDLSISDTKGNSYSVHAVRGNGSTVVVFVFSSVISNALTTSDTITLTVVSGTGRWALDVEEFDNVLTSGAFDQTTNNTGNSTSLSSGVTGATSNANELVFGSFGYSAGRTFTAGSGFTASSQQATTGGSNDRALNNEWKFVTTTGTQEATASLSTSSAYTGLITTFRVNAPDTGARAKIGLNDGSTSGYMTTLTFNNALTANHNVYLPDASGTLCLDSGNCSAAGGYIVNGTTLQTGNFNISGTGTAGTSFLAPLLDTASAGTLSVGTATATAVSISRTGVTTTINGALAVSETATLNGAQLTNNGSTLNSASSLGNFASGGSIGSAATTVDIKTAFTINQTTAGQTITLPNPTSATAGRIVYVTNIGSATFTMYGINMATSSYASFLWNGSAWTATASAGVTGIGTIDSQTKSADGAVISGNSIYLQTADATNPGLVSTGTQTFAGAKTFNGAVTMSAAGTALTVTNNISAGTINNLTLTSAADGFTVAGGTTSRTLTVTGANITVGSTIQPTAAGTLAIQSNGANTMTVDAGGAATLNLGTANANAVSISRTGITTTVNGALTVTQAATMSSTLTVSGTLFTNAGATLNTVSSLSDFATGGSIGSAATTVDVKTAFTINQTTGSQTLTLPSPTNAAAGRIVYVSNIGSAAFTMHGIVIASGSNASYLWNGTAWKPTIDPGISSVGTIDSQTKSANGAVIAGTSLYLQTADATNPGLVSTGTQTFAGDKTFSGLLQGSGGLTITGATSINTTGTANTAIGNATGTFSLASSALNVSTAGALTGVTGITTSGGYTQSGSSANTFTGTTTISAASGLVLGTASTATGGIIFQGSGGAGTLTLVGPTTPDAGNYTLSIPAITSNATICVTGTICAGYQAAPSTGSFLKQVPTTSAENTVSPTAAGIIGLTVNATTGGTSGQAMLVTQSQDADTMTVRATNTTGLQTNGLTVTRNGAGGATTNLLNISNANGTVTNAINITGTYTNLINHSAFTVTNAGALTAVGVNAGSGSLQGTGGLTVSGATSINTTGTANTAIGNATGTFSLASSALNVSTAGALTGVTGITTSGGYTQSGSSANTFTGASSFNALTATSVNSLTLTSATDGFTIAGGTTSRTLTVTGANITIGSIIQPTAAGALDIRSNGASNMGVDAGGAAALNLGITNANAVSISRTGVTTTVNGALTVSEASTFNGNVGISGSNTLTVGGATTLNGSTSVTGSATLSVGTGATSLGGNLTVAGTTTLNGTQLTNAGATLNTVLVLSDFGASGSIGSAATTVDIKTAIVIEQSTASISLTLPTPTDNTAAGRIVYVTNRGTTSFTINSSLIGINVTYAYMWNGATWTFLGASSGVTAVGAFGTQASSPNGAVISGTTIYFQAADTSNAGMVTTGAQTFAGAKTFNALLTGGAGITISGGAVQLTGNTGSSLSTTSGALTITSAAAATWSTTAGDLKLQAGSGTVSLGNSTVLTADGALGVNAGAALSLSSGGATNVTLDTGGAATINIGTTNTTAINIGRNTITTTNQGHLSVTQNTTLGSAGSSVFTNNSATLNTALAIADKPSGGALGTAATTVDVYTAFIVTQTTAGQALSIPNPTNAAVGRIIYITSSNSSSASFTIGSITFSANTTQAYMWNGTQWTLLTVDTGVTAVGAIDSQTASANGAVIVGNTIYLQTAGASTVGLVNTGAQNFAGVKTFNSGVTIGTGAGIGSFVNNGTTLNTVLTITDKPSGGAIGSAASTVDLYTAFVITQTTADQTLSVPDPTVATAGRVIYLSSSTSSTASFTLLGTVIYPGTTATLFWNGAFWTYAGTDSNSILNQNSFDQSASFRIGGTGAINTNSATAFVVQNASGATSLLVDTNTGVGANLAVNGGAETSGSFSADWTQHGTATVARTTTAGEFASGTAGARAVVTLANAGIRNNLGAALATNTTYIVSFSVRSTVNWASSDIEIEYYRNGTPTLDATCNEPAATITISTTFMKYTCRFTTTATAGATSAFLAIRQTAAVSRTMYIDNLSITAQNSTGVHNTNQLRVGGDTSQGLTLFTLDRLAGPPQAVGATVNPSLFGSMYYDTTIGKVQCYESIGWNACGNAPDLSVNLIPEYTGAVLNGTGIGTMTADLCSGTSRLSINTSICSASEEYNYYRWTSPQATNQTYSIYLRYQLPVTFKNFADANTITLTARTSSTSDGSVAFTMYKPDGTLCGTATTVTSSNNTWQTVSLGGDETTCSLAANNIVLFKIDVTARNNAIVYASNLSFLTKGQ